MKQVFFFIFTIFIGTAIIFLLSRLSPVNPIDIILSRLIAIGGRISSEEHEQIKATFMRLYGLDKPICEQYILFIQGFIKGDLGPSFSFFPKKVIDLIRESIPWTIGLLASATIISWIIGNLLGAIAGYFSDRRWAKIMENIFLTIYPMPYVILALVIALLFIYLIPLFPYMGGTPMGVERTFSLKFILGVIKHAFLPAISVIIASLSGWFLSMRALTLNTKTELYVDYAELRGIPKKKIMRSYIFKNSLLPQITALALNLGFIFNGSMITENIFAYPGLGYLMYYAIANGDYNLMVGIATFAIISICLGIFIVEMSLPLIDPRIKYEE